MPLRYPRNFGVCRVLKDEQSRLVVSHISQKTSEMWGTQGSWSIWNSQLPAARPKTQAATEKV
jgi:hypothetical protein